MGLQNLVVRWWVTFVITSIIIGTALWAGMARMIVDCDRTYLSWVVIAIFMLSSVHLGYKVYNSSYNIDYGVTEKAAEFCTSIGLLGTIIGLTIAITGAFADVDVSNQESLKAASGAIASGVGSALLTTLSGLVASLGIQLQVLAVKEKWGA